MNNNNEQIDDLIDPNKLDLIAAGDKGLQQELLEIFFLNVSECISLMEKVCNDGACEKWKDAAEELEAISHSLGAIHLEKISKIAERLYATNQDEKKKVISNIRTNVHKLRIFVKDTRY